MTMRRRALALALAAVACGATGAQAGPIGSGTGTGIKDWLSVYQDVGHGHAGRGLCEYAVDPGPTGHFEAGLDATTGGSFNVSQDVVSLDVTCTFYGTATGTLVLHDSTGASPAVDVVDQGVKRPTNICLNARIEWTNGDVFSVSNYCQRGRVSWRDDLTFAEVGLSSGTDSLVDAGTGAGIGCTDPRGGCRDGVQHFVNQVGTGSFDSSPVEAEVQVTPPALPDCVGGSRAQVCPQLPVRP
jgi:hypothetical protein